MAPGASLIPLLNIIKKNVQRKQIGVQVTLELKALLRAVVISEANNYPNNVLYFRIQKELGNSLQQFRRGIKTSIVA